MTDVRIFTVAQGDLKAKHSFPLSSLWQGHRSETTISQIRYYWFVHKTPQN